MHKCPICSFYGNYIHNWTTKWKEGKAINSFFKMILNIGYKIGVCFCFQNLVYPSSENFALSSSFVDNSISCFCINMDSSVFEVWIGLRAKFYGTFRKGTDLLVSKDFRLLWTSRDKPFVSQKTNDISSKKWWITRSNWLCIVQISKFAFHWKIFRF